MDRLDKNEPFIYYAGTKADFAGLTEFITGNSNGNGLELFIILDLPFSLVADTILFPYYLISSHGKELYTPEFIEAEKLHKTGRYQEALKLYNEAASRNHPLAIFKLGIYHLDGMGTERDIKKAYKYFESAAIYRIQGAFNNLILLNYEGKDIPKNNKEAYKWLFISCNGDLSQSEAWLSILQSEMSEKEIEDAEKLANAWLSENKNL